MKKTLVLILTLCLILSAFAGMTFTASAEDATPIFTVTTKYGGSTAYVTPADNSVVDSAVQVNTEITTGLVMVYRENNAEVYSVQGVVDWLKDEDAILRFWVEMPWVEGTPDVSLGIDLYMEYAIGGTTNYPRTTQYVTLSADGLWHEVRMSASGFATTAFDAGLENPENTVFKNFNIRVRTKTAAEAIASGELTLSPVEFYNAHLATELNDGNIDREYFVLDGASKGADKEIASNITVTQSGAAGNKFAKKAAKITAKTDGAIPSGMRVFPYSNTLTIAEGETVNELGSWVNTEGAEMRTYVRNVNDYEITFKFGLYAVVSYNGSTTYPQLFAKEKVTLPANSGWVELRYTAKDLGFYEDYINKFTLTTGYVTVNIQAADDNFLKNAGDSLYVTPLEICNMDIVEGEADPNKDFNRSAVFNDNYSWGTKATFTRTYTDCADLPYFSKAVTFTANDTYTGTSDRLNALVDNHVLADDFADWAFNPDAELRFWVKSTEDRAFKLTFQQNNKDIYTNITVTCSDNWQEIVLKRSDFSTNTDFDNALLNNITNSDMDIYCFLNTAENNFKIGESLMMGGILEIFSGKAYAKGDANRDNAVNLKDLVRTKKLIATWGTDIYTADVDNTRSLNADDLVYLRNWLINKAWN